ncbi:prostatic acid phosphatase [Anastrepha obliqua]|uniref:prostatic acid phosphatase n=1 Tax=Anastrepha obliqua TaxID=95512 RepID=UPI00240964F8|nr:prostatic acid phosphatase [Anastrepha obliqua]XP_054734336.1 prostatic acid phosphatase [Anastrepha obliqua]
MTEIQNLYKSQWLLNSLLLFTLCFASSTLADLETATISHYSEPRQQTESNALKGKLVFAHVLYRHGDRTPIEPYPTDPWKKREFWPVGWGELTNLGKKQHYELGKWLRQRYHSLLNLTYSEDEIYVRSTDIDRTLASAMSNLAGLYPPVGNEIWNKDIAWQPIPVHTIPERLDKELAGKAPCAAYDYARSAVLNSLEFQKLNERFQYLYDYLTKYSGHKVDTLEAVQRINNTFFIETLYNRTLPEWTKKVYPSADMTYIADFAFSITTYTRHMARLKAGPLIKEMLHRFADKTRGSLKPDRSVWIYSAHDTTVANVLNALNLYNMKSPGYTACLLFELRLDEHNKPFVSIFYKNTTTEATLLSIPKCGVACPLEQLFEIYQDILPANWEQECKLSTMMMAYDDANIGLAMAILGTIICIMLLLSTIFLMYSRRRRYSYSAFTQRA